MRSLRNASILITGGGSGLGRGAALHFVRCGAKVTICGRRQNKIDAVAKELGKNCLAVQGDITIAGDRQRIVDAAIQHGNGLFALINNAGNMYRGSIEELQEEHLLEIFHSNVIAGMMLSGLTLPHLEKTQGAIIFIGSTHTRRAMPGASPYAASKAAVQGLSRVLAAELGPKKIRVNCILPGAVFTEINQRAGLFDDETAKKRLDGLSDMHVLGRIGTEKEIAEAIEYLIRAEWTTGAVVEVDGGFGLGALNA